MSLAQALADAIIDAHNEEGRALTPATWLQHTRLLSIVDEDAVFACLPPWAQRRLDPAANIPMAHVPSLSVDDLFGAGV